MIVRSIIDNPNQSFDFFNDARDTIYWLQGYAKAITNHPERFENPPSPDSLLKIAKDLEEKYEKYLENIDASRSKN